MTIEPSGHMVAKIHLPLRAEDDGTPVSAAAGQGGRGRMLTHWFHH
jgi:hypothetical protein